MEQSMELLYRGGVVMIPILLTSIMAVAIGIERFFAYRRASRGGGEALAEVFDALRRKDMARGRAICGQLPEAAAAVVAKGLAVYRPGRVDVLREAMEGAAAVQATGLRRRLSYLSTIVTVAPLLGLLGTVVGMIKTFNVLAVSAGQPSAVTGGVGEALIATAAGLVVAIVAMLIHSFYSEWLEGIISRMELAANGVIEALEGGADDEAVGL